MTQPKKPVKLGDLRKPRAPANTPPAGGVPPALAKLAGLGAGTGHSGQGLPFTTGQVILTEFEKKELSKHGWKEGDPIPTHFAELYATVNALKAEADTVPEEYANLKDVTQPLASDIRDLPQAKQDELAAALRDAKAQAEMYRKRKDAKIEGAPPGVNEAIDAGMQQPFETLIDDDLRPKQEPAKVAAPSQTLPSNDADLDAKPGAGGADRPKNCPHCGWDQDRIELIEATDEDKLKWLISQEGATRFTKDYSILNGRVTLTFRSLTAKESDIAWRQVAVDGGKDLRSKGPETEDNYWRNLMTYRMVMSLERKLSATSGPQLNPALDEWQIDPDDYPAPNTKVYAMLPAVTEVMFPTETLRRQIGNAFHKFQLLVEHLEAHADTDSFWQGIGQQP